MLDTSARLLRLLSLLQSRPEWTGPELAARLGVTTRTIRNDVTRLRNLGYPVAAAPGTTGGYRLGVGAVLPPLLLDDDEAGAGALRPRPGAPPRPRVAPGGPPPRGPAPATPPRPPPPPWGACPPGCGCPPPPPRSPPACRSAPAWSPPSTRPAAPSTAVPTPRTSSPFTS